MTALRKGDEPRPVKLTVEDFLRLDAAGAFASYAKTELIEGVIVAMNAQHAAHARAQGRLFRRLAEAVERFLPGHEALIVEISDTTLAFDLGTKARAYAANNIAEYWVVDLPGGRVRQLWSPSANGYAESREIAIGQPIEAVTLTGLRVETAGI
ncbi:MAG: Uma2 family endonuclease [Allosphingosinicella sp.]|uniref:Uma2 family endonuclease n=1 Tax=Allosphingosinicella sp. TaxID=2823234 RepID=UPI0039312A0B